MESLLANRVPEAVTKPRVGSQLCTRRKYDAGLESPLVLAAPAAHVREETDDDDECCDAAIPGRDRPWIAILHIADDPVPGKHDP
jgi:hypothetical protein